MRTVYKYPFNNLVSLEAEVPVGFKVVLAGMEDGHFCVWLEVETDAATEAVKFYVHPTGGVIEAGREHVGSFQQSMFVWHIYKGEAGRP